MPLYEYSCQKCHTVVEKIQKFSDPPLLVCETCGGPLLKLMGKPALQFKGSGFYITDYVKKDGGGGTGGGGETNSPAPATSWIPHRQLPRRPPLRHPLLPPRQRQPDRRSGQGALASTDPMAKVRCWARSGRYETT